MTSAADIIETERKRDIRNRWLLSAPALLIIFAAAVGPLLIVLAYSFMKAAPYGDVIPDFSTDGWVSVFMQRDIFDDTWAAADAHLSIFLRSLKLSLMTTVLTLLVGFPTA